MLDVCILGMSNKSSSQSEFTQPKSAWSESTHDKKCLGNSHRGAKGSFLKRAYGQFTPRFEKTTKDPYAVGIEFKQLSHEAFREYLCHKSLLMPLSLPLTTKTHNISRNRFFVNKSLQFISLQNIHS